MAKGLIKNQLPVNENTIKVLNRAVILLGQDNSSLEKGLFMMKNDIPINSKNTNILNGFVNKESDITQNLKLIENQINDLENTPLKDKLVEIFKNNSQTNEPVNAQSKQITNATAEQLKNNTVVTPQETVLNDTKVSKGEQTIIENKNENKPPENILKNNELTKDESYKSTEIINKNETEILIKGKDKLHEQEQIETKSNDNNLKSELKLKGDNPIEVDKFINEVKEKLNEATKILEKETSPNAQKLVETITNTNDKIDFLNQVKDNMYMQIPLNIKDHQTDGELLIFKDKRAKKGSKQGLSAIVGLDTVNMGRFETYIQKTDKNVSFQFRLESEEVVNLVKENMQKLSEMLEPYNVNIESVTFKKIENPFTIISTEMSQENELKLNNFKLNIRM